MVGNLHKSRNSPEAVLLLMRYVVMGGQIAII